MVANTRTEGGRRSTRSTKVELPEEVVPEDDSVSDEEDEVMEEGNDDAANDDDEEEESSDDSENEDEEKEDSDDDDDDAEENRVAANSIQINPIVSANGEQCTFDLRNLVAMNVHQVNSASLYSTKTKKKASNESLTIPPDNLGVVVNEDYILEKATDGCTQLVGALWQLPTERSDVGPMVFLPTYDDIKIPRALPPPPPKRETKWEKFAKEKGLPMNKEKRSRKVWDEATGTWLFRHGYQKANDSSKEWPIMEVNPNDDPFADPWEKGREAKRTKVEKNVENRMRNEERAGVLSKGTTTRMLKSKEKTRQAGRTGGNVDRDMSLPAGVPVDLRASKIDGDSTPAQRGKTSITAALLATQRSTASLGKFDKMREGEPERKKAVTALKKRKLESATDKKVTANEAERGLKVLRTVIEGGGVAKERARKKGQLAKGETAYDYDFDDGRGASSFKKKKGRAGAGKQKKMTKKRIK